MDTKLDAALGLWARDERVDAAAVERLLLRAEQIPAQAVSRPRRWLPWAAGGGALAASVAAALLIAVPGESPADMAQVAAVPSDDFAGQASFSLLHTPTADEEQFI